MKKSMIFAMCAFAFAFASCEQNGGSDLPKGELEQSYVAITLAAPDLGTRAADGFDEGTTAERAVKKAYVFFYDAAGNPFPVTASAPGLVNTENYLEITLDENGNDPSNGTTTNVSDVKNRVVVLNNYEGVYPSQVVAVLNYTPDSEDKDLSIADLQKKIVTLGNTANGFVMSNSVYAEGAAEVVATPLTGANFATSADAAKNNPVKIYVERIAAKVSVIANGNTGTVDHMYTLNNTFINGISGQQVYAEVLGWELSNYNTSSLLKDVDPSWTLGFDWLGDFRSFWAKTNQIANVPAITGVDAITNFDPIYTGENTTAQAAEVVIRARLCTYNGSTYEPCALAKWFGYEYVGEENLLTAVRNNIMSTYYYSGGGSYVAIGVDDLMTVAGNGTNAKVYEVYFQLSDTGDDRTWYVIEGGEYVQKSVAEINAALASIQPALFYKDGYTYYHTPIVHIFTDPVTKGVVRNHSYNITINSIAGYGTPITGGNLVTPETPQETSSYVAAEINVLSWRTVSYEVDIR